MSRFRLMVSWDEREQIGLLSQRIQCGSTLEYTIEYTTVRKETRSLYSKRYLEKNTLVLESNDKSEQKCN